MDVNDWVDLEVWCQISSKIVVRIEDQAKDQAKDHVFDTIIGHVKTPLWLYTYHQLWDDVDGE
jgi:hypothetical protein